jgi:DNA replication protein DnaC
MLTTTPLAPRRLTVCRGRPIFVTVIYEQIKDDLGYLQIDRAAEVFATLAEHARTDDWTHIEFLARLIAEQADATRNRRLTARLRYARFPFRKTIDEFDFAFQPTVDRRLVDDLATLRFMDTGRPILFLGQPGCGKTHLAVAIATLAVEAGFRGYFTNAEEMVANIAQATREGNLASKLKTYTAPSVLVIDDVGLLPMDRAAASAFYQVVNLRYEKQHSTIVTTNRGLPDWGEIFGDTVVAAAILDRLMHNAVVFNIKGPSWRLREHQALTTATTDPTKEAPLTSPAEDEPHPATATFVDRRTRLSLIANSRAPGAGRYQASTACGAIAGWTRWSKSFLPHRSKRQTDS